MGDRNLHHADEHHVQWELDGGGSNTHDCVVLFEGRLYTDARALRIAKIRARAKRLGRFATVVAPILLLLTGRN